MKSFLVIIVLVAFYQCGSRKIDNSIEGIKSIKTVEKKVDPNYPTSERDTYEEFDQDGNAVLSVTNSWRGKERLERKFNDRDQKIEVFSEMYMGVFYHIKFLYNEDGELIHSIWFNEDGSLDREMKIEIDLDSLLQKEFTINTGQDTALWSVVTLNEELQPLSKSHFSKEGKITLLTSFNKKGAPEHIINFGSDGVKKSETNYYYTRGGNKRRELQVFYPGRNIRQIEKFYKDEKLVKKVNSSDDVALASTIKFTYDEQGNILSEEKVKKGGERDYLKHFEYEFDSRKNWTKKKEFYNGKLVLETNRIIEYY